ncbi:MAG: Cystathionine gamma-synthase [Candidatus Hydrogenedentota bacterium]|jgi:cystathionine gamma-synthase
MNDDNPRDLLLHPLCDAGDLGAPVPDSPHATSVALPLWEHVIGYEEKKPEVISRLRAGYPRFAIHPAVQRLWEEASRTVAQDGERAIVLPSKRASERCAEFLQEKSGCHGRLSPWGAHGLWCTVYPETEHQTALRFWQHFGDVLSSRRAEAALAGAEAETAEAASLRRSLRERVGGFAGEAAEQVFLFASGMGAMASALRAVRAHAPGRKTLQLGFPYVDGLKMQTVSGPGAHFFPVVDDAAYEAIETLARAGQLAGVFCEAPGNPLLETPNLFRLAGILRPCGVPLVVDDTVASFHNINPLPHADLLASSLTKLVSGAGDVMAGSLIVSSHSPLRDALLPLVRESHEELLWEGDALALEHNSRDYAERARRVNENTAAVVAHLRSHPAVDSIWYPEGDANYEALRRPGGGHGGLFSMLLKQPAERSQPFYDRLRITKGPSLGTNFSLVCPYTLLAHYDELDWAESLGISRHLIRCAIGLEDPADLIARFDAALAG